MNNNHALIAPDDIYHGGLLESERAELSLANSRICHGEPIVAANKIHGVILRLQEIERSLRQSGKKKIVKCPDCHGSGKWHIGWPDKCSHCKGTGKVTPFRYRQWLKALGYEEPEISRAVAAAE